MEGEALGDSGKWRRMAKALLIGGWSLVMSGGKRKQECMLVEQMD